MTTYGQLRIQSTDISSTSESDLPWVQPNLASNGTTGGATYGCYTTCPYNPATAFQAFDSNSSTGALQYFASPYMNQADLIFYSPDPLKITSIIMNGYCIVTGTISYSDDNSAWYECGTYTRETWGSGTWTVDLNTDNQYHQWWKFWYYNSAGTSSPALYSVTMNGTKWDRISDPVANAWVSDVEQKLYIKY